jgi:hypothetical protein
MRINNLLMLLFVLIISCTSENKKKLNQEIPLRDTSKIMDNAGINTNDTIIENRALDSVFKVAEVQKLSNFIDSLSNHTRGVAMITRQKPEGQRNYYWIQVGDNNGLSFQPTYNFYVYPDNFEIKFLNTMKDDSLMTLTEWRKSDKDSYNRLP